MNDSVVIIATANHLSALEKRLKKRKFDLDTLKKQNQYIPVEAISALSKFIVNDWPDEKLFNEFIAGIFDRAKKGKRKIRAFGEMVAIMWEQGYNGATVHLEHLWHQLQKKNSFTLYCAYPRSGFTQCANDSIDTICQKHSMIIEGKTRPSTDVYYKRVADG